MNRTAIRRTIPAIMLSGLAAVPAGQALAAGHHAAKARTFRGPTVSSQYGTVQVSIVVKSKKIATVQAAYAPLDVRGQFIEGQAIPLLKQETLRAQSARINLVSGATQTSEAYIESLQSAIKSAAKHRALK